MIELKLFYSVPIDIPMPTTNTSPVTNCLSLAAPHPASQRDVEAIEEKWKLYAW